MIPQITTVSAVPVAEQIPWSEVELLGTASGTQFGRHKDGRELRIGSPVEAWEKDNAPGPNEVHITKRERYQDRSMAFAEMRTVTVRATVVPAGSFEQAKEREAAKQEANARRANPGYRAVDALAASSALSARLGTFIVGSAEPNPLLSQSTPALAIPGRAAIRGPRAILDYLDAKGIRLEVTPDGSGVLVRAKSGRLDSSTREAIRATARLLAGTLSGNPITCELCRGKDRRPAITIAEVDVAVCEQHASEELPE